MKTTPIETSAGKFLAHYSKQGLARLDFPDDHSAPPKGEETSPPPAPWVRQTRAALEAVLAGRPPKVLPPLDLSTGTHFQRAVWQTLQTIPPGQTLSYAEVARCLGRPRGFRAVGGACGANPVPVLIPCHRVLTSDRRLGGFSGGLPWKRRLLKREGVSVA